MSWIALFTFWILLYVKRAGCVKMTELQVPDRVIVGDTIHLTCRFDLEGDTLYSVKWYRNDLEFYSYAPSNVPFARPIKNVYPWKGIRVDMLRSGNDSVTLENVDLTTSGEFKCEVSADSPSFQVDFFIFKLTVKERDGASSVPISYGLVSIAALLGMLIW